MEALIPLWILCAPAALVVVIGLLPGSKTTALSRPYSDEVDRAGLPGRPQ